MLVVREAVYFDLNNRLSEVAKIQNGRTACYTSSPIAESLSSYNFVPYQVGHLRAFERVKPYFRIRLDPSLVISCCRRWWSVCHDCDY